MTDELTCNVCLKPMIGSGVILMNDHNGPAWQDELCQVFPSGVQYMMLHPACYLDVWDNICRIEGHSVIYTVGFGGVGDLIRAISGDEDDGD